MKIHITSIYGLGGVAGDTARAVAHLAKDVLHYNELGIYHYPFETDSPEMLRARLDGILSSVSHGDIVIFQSPTWNDLQFDKAFMERLDVYAGIKKIVFIHDVLPLMFESNRYLMGVCMEIYNQADVLIVPSQNMADFLQSEGLTARKLVVQKMWDIPISIDRSVKPRFRKVINFAGKTDNFKFSFAREWKYDTVRLAVTEREDEWREHNANVEFLGWFQDQSLLANTMRKNGGFGLLWTNNEYCYEYLKMNACSKLSLYLAAGLPVIVPADIPEAGTIVRKNLGIAVRTLDEAVARVEKMTEEQYNHMVQNAEVFGGLVRGGFFTKKVLTDAVFHLLYD